MHDAKGRAFAGKTNGDAEGVASAWRDDALFHSRAIIACWRSTLGVTRRCRSRRTPIVTGGYGQPMAEAFAAKKLEVGSNEAPSRWR